MAEVAHSTTSIEGGHTDVSAGGASGFMSGTDKTKLDGIADGADVTADNPPQAHAASHKSGGGDALALSDLAVPTADVSLNSNKLTNVTDPASAQDAATKNYVDTHVATGGTDNRLLRSDGTGGHTTQASAVGCDDSGVLSGGSLDATMGAASIAALVGVSPQFGDQLWYDGSSWNNLRFPTGTINTDANQTPAVADGEIFHVDRTALTTTRTITPSTSGATKGRTMTFKLGTSGSAHKYTLVCGADSIDLDTDKMIADCHFDGSAWVYDTKHYPT